MDNKEFSIPEQFTLNSVVYPGLLTDAESIQRADSLTPQPGDVLTASYPRSGSTWLLHAISLIQAKGDLDAVNAVPLEERVPFLEVHQWLRQRMHTEPLPRFSGRIMRTHVQYNYIKNLVKEKGMKTIVILRNPKDILVSYYHFYQMNTRLGCYDRSWDELFELFRDKKLAFGDWLDHVSGFWKNCSGLPNVLFVHYEDAKGDIHNTLRRMCTFLEHNLNDTVLDQIVDHISIVNMKKNSSVNYQKFKEKGIFRDADVFIRKGEVGGWRNYFSEEQSRYMDENYIKHAQDMGIMIKSSSQDKLKEAS